MLGEVIAVAARELGDDAAAVLARIAGPIGDDARAARAGNQAARAGWAAAARAPVPSGFRGVDPGWIEAALIDLPSVARAAVAAGGGDPVGVWLARWACARIPPMPAVVDRNPDERARSLDELLALSGPRLRAWLDATGADQLALALSAAGPEAVASAVRVLGRALPAPRGGLGSTRAAIARCRNVALDELALVRIGARAIAPYVVRRALARDQLMHRLPRAVGLIVGRELAAHARDDLAQCPAWSVPGQ